MACSTYLSRGCCLYGSSSHDVRRGLASAPLWWGGRGRGGRSGRGRARASRRRSPRSRLRRGGGGGRRGHGLRFRGLGAVELGRGETGAFVGLAGDCLRKGKDGKGGRLGAERGTQSKRNEKLVVVASLGAGIWGCTYQACLRTSCRTSCRFCRTSCHRCGARKGVAREPGVGGSRGGWRTGTGQRPRGTKIDHRKGRPSGMCVPVPAPRSSSLVAHSNVPVSVSFRPSPPRRTFPLLGERRGGVRGVSTGTSIDSARGKIARHGSALFVGIDRAGNRT